MGSIPTSDTAERSLSRSERNLKTASVVVSVWEAFRPQIQPNAACPVRNVTSKRRVWSSQYGKHSDLRYSRTQPSHRNVTSTGECGRLREFRPQITERSLSHSERNLNTASVVVSVWEAFRPQIQPNAACPVRNIQPNAACPIRNVTSTRRVWSSQYGLFRPQIQPNAACPVRNASKRRVWSSQYGKHSTSDTPNAACRSERNLKTASVVVSVWEAFRPQIQPNAAVPERNLECGRPDNPQIQPNAACPVRNVTSKRRVWSSQYGKHSDLRYSRTQPVPFGT
ncbi:hypothetical protein J6590_039967 [Homalodisca vitripennis]|nr:hypothetical protein J6590_039967 [Homalodisca vitripennis]